MEYEDKFAVRKLRKEEWASWDSFVLQQRDGTLFHTSIWLKHQPNRYLEIYGMFLDGNLVGGLPCSILTKFGFRILALPIMTPYSGPVLSDKLILDRESESAAISLMKLISQFDAVRFKFSPDATQMSDIFSRKMKSEKRRTNIIRNNSSEVVESNYHQNIRRNLKKAIRNEISVSESANFFDIYIMSKKSLEFSGRAHPFSESQFIKMAEELNDLGLAKGYLAYLPDGKPIACSWIPKDGRFGYNIIHGIDRMYRDLQAGPLVLATAISDCMNQKLSFDFEGSMIDRIQTFYKKFGADQVEITECSKIQSRRLQFINRITGKNF